MNLIKHAQRLEGIHYDLRGPLLKTAQQLEQQGHHVLKLNLGNPAPFGLTAPQEIISQVLQHLPTNQGYCDSKGLYTARAAIVAYYQAQGLADLTADRVFIGNGVSELIVQALQALLNPGDEILVPMPDYPLWTAAVSLCGGHVVHYLCDEGADWFPDLTDLQRKITPRTRGIVLINPNNPTGAVYSRSLLLEIARLAREHQLILFSDEIYDQILYEGTQHHKIAALAPDVLTITFNGLSKAYFLAGFRQGWIVITGPIHLAQSYLQGLELLASMRLCANVPMQYAIPIALNTPHYIREMTQPGGQLYEQSHHAWQLLNQIPGVSCVKASGAIYLFPRLDRQRFQLSDDQQLALDLLRQEKVLLIHGRGFNWPYPDHLRIVTLPSITQLESAIGQLARFLSTYRQ
ncbi:pyridoxal phosphate-dependent aminotransferase [unidentified bacterial endosymbiont]|uniref:pyridoxal phosphate-dependent aminotransferase n=1 Tax=unidentified bacterial endosymbiont TaxID=2355 RepID=UPI00209F352A|nr:pyridoxal phosphate-dependent aminotransferase [unidentified bacterial endosymbiont]